MRRYTLGLRGREFVVDVQELAADRFEVVVGADTVHSAKPAPDPALHALARLHVDATDAAFVEHRCWRRRGSGWA